MPLAIGLDSNVLGTLSHPKGRDHAAVTLWMERQLQSGNQIVIPQIADYELRRELLLINSQRGLRTLDRLIQTVEYLPLTTEAIYRAAALWAELRKRGQSTADPHALDGDVILAAQLLTWLPEQWTLVVATVNVRHLNRMVDARPWQQITV